MDEHLSRSIKFYENLAHSEANEAIREGRPKSSQGAAEVAAWQDVFHKLRVSKGMSVLDIGCGCGYFAKRWMESAKEENYELFLLDAPKVIERLMAEYGSVSEGFSELIHIFKGVFPESGCHDIFSKTYDRIVFYSVLHYSSDPKFLIEKAASLLRPGGRLLLGDLPNMTKKARLLSSEFGRKTEAAYRGVSLDQVPVYLSPEEYLSQHASKDLANINDSFVFDILSTYRKPGFEAYVVEQPANLTFSLTREDIVICKLPQ